MANLDKSLKDVSVAEAIKLRGGGAAQVRQVASEYQGMSVSEIANLAAKGDKNASTALKMVKQAASKAEKYNK